MDDRRLESSGDPGHSSVSDVWTPPRLPAEHERMGLSRNTEEGALLEFANALNPSRPAHRVVAWIALLALGLPVLFSLLSLLRGL
jgi:hypothetical protein